MSAEDQRECRLRISEAIQRDAPSLENVERSILTGWVVVAEWMADDGSKWLSKNSGDAAGERLTEWGVNGMLHEGLNTTWETDQS